MHFHGIHPADMDGVPMVGRGVILPGESFTYTFDAEPFGLHLYHCHVGPLAEHIARGMYGTFIIDPPRDRPPADELVMVMHGYNTTFDGQSNQLYAVNGIPFHYMHEPVRVRRGELVRIYLINILEYDPINSFHIHGNFFDYYPTGTRLRPTEFTDTVSADFMLRAIRRLVETHLVLIVVLRDEELEALAAADPQNADDVTRAITAADLLKDRKVAISRLQHLGVHVVEAEYDKVSERLVQSYLELKKRNAL